MRVLQVFQAGRATTREIVNDLDLAPERARLRVHHLGSASDNTGPLQKIYCLMTSMLAEVSHFMRFGFPVVGLLPLAGMLGSSLGF